MLKAKYLTPLIMLLLAVVPVYGANSENAGNGGSGQGETSMKQNQNKTGSALETQAKQMAKKAQKGDQLVKVYFYTQTDSDTQETSAQKQPWGYAVVVTSQGMVVFNGHNLVEGTNYSLYYDGTLVGEAVANECGHVHIKGTLPVDTDIDSANFIVENTDGSVMAGQSEKLEFGKSSDSAKQQKGSSNAAQGGEGQGDSKGANQGGNTGSKGGSSSSKGGSK